MGLQLLTEPPGWKILTGKYGIAEDQVKKISQILGISGVCNVLGAIKAAKFYGLGKEDLIVTACTDTVGRYRSVMEELTQTHGPMDEIEAQVRLVSIFHKQKLDWIEEGTQRNRNQWHNLKYFTWVEQQGKTVEELNAQRSQDYWEAQQLQVAEVDQLIESYRGKV
jgi:hypothetical protein